jgi:hypothetical protein
VSGPVDVVPGIFDAHCRMLRFKSVEGVEVAAMCLVEAGDLIIVKDLQNLVLVVYVISLDPLFDPRFASQIRFDVRQFDYDQIHEEHALGVSCGACGEEL